MTEECADSGGPIACVFVAGCADVLALADSRDPRLQYALRSARTVFDIPFPPAILSAYPALSPRDFPPQIALVCNLPTLFPPASNKEDSRPARDFPCTSVCVCVCVCLWQFCFPDGLHVQAQALEPRMTHVVSTNERGSRLYVTCLVCSAPVVPATLAALARQHADAQDSPDSAAHVPPAAHLPCAVCVCSTAPLFSFARVWLRHLHALATARGPASPAVATAIATLIHKGLQKPIPVFIINCVPFVLSPVTSLLFAQFQDHYQEGQQCRWCWTARGCRACG